MNHNLNVPWGDRCSPPQTPYMTFYSHDTETLIFDKGSKIEIYCQAGLRSVGLTWTLHRNMITKSFRQGQAEALPANRFRITVDTAGLYPGFYDLKVCLDTGVVEPNAKDDRDKRPIEGVCVFGWKPEKMAIRDSRHADFRAFWDKAMSDYAKIPLDPKIEGETTVFKGKEIDDYNVNSACLPPNYDPAGCKVDEVESFKISFAGPDGGRVYAWLAKPRGNGPFPAMLVLPGAGFASRPRPLEHARHGYLALDVQVHGQDVDQAKYDPISGYSNAWVYEPVDKFYFKNLYLRAVRAVEFLCSRPDVDTTTLVTTGGSQGGRLAIVVPALDRRVTATISCIANSPNHPHLTWIAKCNGLDCPTDDPAQPEFRDRPGVDGMNLVDAPPVVDSPEYRCWAYYDPMNFAPDVKCPALFNVGLTDPCSPPYSVWAAYLRLGTRDKTIIPMPGFGHDWFPEFDRRAWAWIQERHH